MSLNKPDRASLRRQAQRKESYACLISKRKYMPSVSDIRSNKKSKIESMKNSEVEDLKNEEENVIENIDNTSILPTIKKENISPESCEDNQPRFSSNIKRVQTNKVQNELENFPVMTRSNTRKYASVGALYNKVDWDHQMKVTKRWPPHVAYNIQGPLVQNIELRDVLTKSLSEVMAFCKNVWTVNNELQIPQEENQFSIVIGESSDFFECGLQETVNENENILLQQQILDIISMNNENQRETVYIQEVNADCETITLHSDETYILGREFEGSSYFEQIGSAHIQELVYPYNPMKAVLNDHNYAQKCDEICTPKSKNDQSNLVNKDKEEEFKLENALNDLLINTAMLKCLVCGESPQDMISFLDRAQAYYS